MGIDNPRVIDALGTENDTGVEVLTIMDAWDWADEPEHLLALGDKINAYLGFVESGQLLEEHPRVEGQARRIDILSRYPFPTHLAAFIDHVRQVAATYSVGVQQRHVGEIDPSAPRANA